MGKGTAETQKIIMENIPEFSFRTKKGARNTITRDFEKVAKSIKPDASKNYINHGEWWAVLTEAGNDQGWSMAMRVRMLARTEGVDKGVHDAYRARVIVMMKSIKDWLPAYWNIYDVHYMNRSNSVRYNQR